MLATTPKVPAVNGPQPREPDGKPAKATRSRNLRTALLLGLIALGFYVAFFYSVSHRGG